MGRFGLCVALIGMALTLLIGPWLELSRWKVFRRCVSVAAALSLWLCTRRFEGRTLGSYGVSWDRAGKRELLLGVTLGAGALGLMLALGLFSGACRIEITPERLRLWRTVLGFIPAAALVGVLEELVFRGLIFQRLLACSTPVAVGSSSALYAFVHLKSPALTLATGRELVGLFLLGAILALSVLATRRLHLAIGLHAVLAYGARVNKLLIQFSDPSLAWLTGTSRLVDGMAAWLALLGVGGGLAAMGRRRA